MCEKIAIIWVIIGISIIMILGVSQLVICFLPTSPIYTGELVKAEFITGGFMSSNSWKLSFKDGFIAMVSDTEPPHGTYYVGKTYDVYKITDFIRVKRRQE